MTYMKTLMMRVASLAGAGAMALTVFAGGGTAVAATRHTTKHVAAKHVAAKHVAKADQVAVDLVTVAKFGRILVDQKGLALYVDSADKPPHFACKGACLVVWPPLVLPKGQAKPIAGKGVTGLGVVKSPSGEQVTWHGKPLYTFVRDSKGTVRGQGIKQDGTWFVAQMKAATTSTAKKKTPSSSWA
jgi:predicted lipoprotein with Yx(FWY)xxD motif